jgi:hypothetical protein
VGKVGVDVIVCVCTCVCAGLRKVGPMRGEKFTEGVEGMGGVRNTGLCLEPKQ